MEKIKYKDMPIYVISDIHGSFSVILDVIQNIEDNSLLFIAGDVGVGFRSFNYYNDLFKLYNNSLSERNISLLLIRGNHDNPAYFSDSLIGYSHIKFLKDYTVVSVGDKNILCVGGAVSIDRKYRMNNFNCIQGDKLSPSYYWEDEMPKYDELSLSEINVNIDYVISHTSPKFCFKYSKDSIKRFISDDEELSNDLDTERNIMSDIYNFLVDNGHNLKKWVYGHFHCHNNEMINGIEFITLLNSDFDIDCIKLN